MFMKLSRQISIGGIEDPVVDEIKAETNPDRIHFDGNNPFRFIA